MIVESNIADNTKSNTDMIIGSFVYRDEGDGCLTGKYMHRDLNTPVTECCKRKSGDGNYRFVGTYLSVWIEETTDTVSTELKIVQSGDLFDLTWTANDGSVSFTGKGMLHGKLLVGCYWD